MMFTFISVTIMEVYFAPQHYSKPYDTLNKHLEYHNRNLVSQLLVKVQFMNKVHPLLILRHKFTSQLHFKIKTGQLLYYTLFTSHECTILHL